MKQDSTTTDIAAHILLAAAFEDGDYGRIASAAEALHQSTCKTTMHEVLRLMHLFYGFPKLIRAWNALPKELRPGKESMNQHMEPEVPGETTFRKLYGSNADRVLEHLNGLDSLTANWIVNHAYGTVMSRSQLALAIKERLAILALASTGCWRQWMSHVDNAQRLGVSIQTLKNDLHSTPWPAKAAKEQALERLA